MTVETKDDVRHGLTAEAVEALSAAKQEPAWMRDWRWQAWQRSQGLSMPSGTEEEWRRTDLRGLTLQDYHLVLPSGQTATRQEERPDAWQARLAVPDTVFGGIVVHQDSTVLWQTCDDVLRHQGVLVCDLDTAVQHHAELVRPYFMTTAVPVHANKFTALHGALWNSGVFIYVPRGVHVQMPIQALTAHMTAGGMMQPHTLLVAEEHSQVTVFDEYISGAADLPGLANGVVELYLKPGAQVTYLQMQNWSRRLWGFANQRAVLAADSQLRWGVAALGSRLHWTSLGVQLREPGSSARLFGLVLTDGRQHLDFQTFQDHQAPHTQSDLLLKTALLGRSRTVFRGRVWLHPQAQQTAAYQANHNLLLDAQARADAIPILEIEADDVQCKHGSTTGRIDDEQLFYLMSRGLSPQEAQRMIVQGFFEMLITEFPIEGLQEKIRQEIQRRI